jgi:hypothetical protein
VRRIARRVPSHPDRDEADAWVRDEVDRLRALDYAQLMRLREVPRHHPFTSRTGRQLAGETCVHRDSVDQGPLRVMVDVWEPRRWRIDSSIASDDFIRASDGRFVGE